MRSAVFNRDTTEPISESLAVYGGFHCVFVVCEANRSRARLISDEEYGIFNLRGIGNEITDVQGIASVKVFKRDVFDGGGNFDRVIARTRDNRGMVSTDGNFVIARARVNRICAARRYRIVAAGRNNNPIVRAGIDILRGCGRRSVFVADFGDDGICGFLNARADYESVARK